MALSALSADPGAPAAEPLWLCRLEVLFFGGLNTGFYFFCFFIFFLGFE